MKSVFYDTYAISFSYFVYKSICCGYLFELPRLAEAIRRVLATYVFYKVADKSTQAAM